MRASQIVDARRVDHGQRDAGRDPKSRAAPEQPGCKHRCRKAQNNRCQACYARQTPPLMEPSEDQIRQPFPSKPGLAWPGKRKEIGDRNPTVVENPISSANVPSRVAIGQQTQPIQWPAKEHEEQNGEESIHQG